MPPKSITYKSNSIIYFKGDIADRIFILNSGKVSLIFNNIETGQEIREHIKTAEFFGVKSALGRYPREETALVIQDSTVVAFTVDEFEQLVSKNTRIIIKMLKVFSNQLRRIHRQVQNLLYMDDQINPETGLYKIGQYYLKNRQYKQAIYALGRYLVYYPSGKYTDDATKNIYQAEENLQKYGQGKGPSVDASCANTVINKPSQSKELSDIGKEYYNGISLISESKYHEASVIFNNIIQKTDNEEYSIKAKFEIGKCLFYLGKFDGCIKVFSSLIQKYPKHPDLGEALFYVAQSNEKTGDKKRAIGLYKKILSLTPEADSLYRKVNKELKRLEK